MIDHTSGPVVENDERARFWSAEAVAIEYFPLPGYCTPAAPVFPAANTNTTPAFVLFSSSVSTPETKDVPPPNEPFQTTNSPLARRATSSARSDAMAVCTHVNEPEPLSERILTALWVTKPLSTSASHKPISSPATIPQTWVEWPCRSDTVAAVV